MVIDVTEQDFATAVIERSRELPVVVDFWAEWCGPCRQLGPLLEDAANRRTGKVVLAKLDTDANPLISRTFGIQGIPAVKAFRDAKIVSEFVGARPRDGVERFFDALVPSEADELAVQGDEESLRRAVELEPTHPEAVVALARLLHGRGESDAALELTGRLGGSFAASALAARIELERRGEPDLAAAFAALDAGDRERAIDELLAALAAEHDGAREPIREVIVGILDELGVDDPLARDARRRLAAALY
jgi:putative thioredoxin